MSAQVFDSTGGPVCLMRGLMQSWPLTIDRILDHAARAHGDRHVVTRSAEGPITRLSYAELRARAKQVSHGLLELGIQPGDRIATLALNSNRHMEAWYGIMGIGAVCHTLNPRMLIDQIAALITHAGDRIVFTDATFAPMLTDILATRETGVECVIILTDDDHAPAALGHDTLIYESWVHGRPTCDEDGAPVWGQFNEEAACGLCYTSGTTGDPKGVAYSHRSNFIHTLISLQPDVLGLSATDVLLPIVPMFHANAWGTVFAAPAVGATLVMPGSKLDGGSIHELLETEQVTVSLAVPTVWQNLLQYLDETGAELTSLKRVVIGGSACPETVMRGFRDRYGVEVRHAWGMTETSPIGTIAVPDAATARLSFDEQLPRRMKQGRAPLGIELRVVDDQGSRLPSDGHAAGRLMVKGPTVAGAYFRLSTSILDADGFFDTGDLATIDAGGFMQITDRAKDLVKSGGEWISSVEIENIVSGHSAVAIAAVVGLPHPRWSERPLLVVQLKSGATATTLELKDFLHGKIASWWMPDEIVFVDDIALGATGKIDKKILRERYADLWSAVA